MQHSSYFMGIDGGGTKCKAILVDPHDRILGQGIAGSANPRFGFKHAMDSIAQAAQAALKDANLPQLALSDIVAGIGLAGVNLPYYFAKVSSWPHPFLRSHLTTDLDIACFGAHQSDQGAVIIVGTGSCGLALYQKQRLALGGYGFPHSDQASGAWIGLQAVSHTLKALDGIGPSTELSSPVLNEFNVKDAIGLSAAVSEGSSADFAVLAHLVFECASQGDPIATGIIQEAVQYLDLLAKKLLQQGSVPLALVGGLKHQFLPWLNPFTLTHLQDSKTSSEMGAIFWARSQEQAQ